MNIMQIPNYDFLKKKIKANSKKYKLLRKCIVEGNKKTKDMNRNLRFASYWMKDQETRDQLIELYNEFYSNIIPPNHSNEVWLATGNGGVLVGFYDNGWKYRAFAKVIKIDAPVLKWWEYNEYRGIK